jgi:type II secretory pathway pseudopilin PulG
MSFGVVAAVVGSTAAVAGLGYTIYKGQQKPASPKQANAQLAANNAKLVKLQTQLQAAQAAGKDTSKIQTQIDDINTSNGYLTQYISGSATSGTPVGFPLSGNATQPGQINWPLLIGGSLVVGAGVAILAHKKKKK